MFIVSPSFLPWNILPAESVLLLRPVRAIRMEHEMVTKNPVLCIVGIKNLFLCIYHITEYLQKQCFCSKIHSINTLFVEKLIDVKWTVWYSKRARWEIGLFFMLKIRVYQGTITKIKYIKYCAWRWNNAYKNYISMHRVQTA